MFTKAQPMPMPFRALMLIVNALEDESLRKRIAPANSNTKNEARYKQAGEAHRITHEDGKEARNQVQDNCDENRRAVLDVPTRNDSRDSACRNHAEGDNRNHIGNVCSGLRKRGSHCCDAGIDAALRSAERVNRHDRNH